MTTDDERIEDLRDWYAEDDLGPSEYRDLIADAVAKSDREVWPSPAAPLAVAHRLYRNWTDPDGLRTLVCHRGTWMLWYGPHWAEMDLADLRKHVYDQLGKVNCLRAIRKDGDIDRFEPIRWDPNKKKVADVLEAMAAVGHISAEIDPPAWLPGPGGAGSNPFNAHGTSNAGLVISCSNGLLDLMTLTVTPHTPALYNLVSVPFAYDPTVPDPAAWLEFLDSVWPDDPESVALLQEYMGYVLSGRTEQQKMMGLFGPTRSGKGTIGRVLPKLVGRGHVVGPTLASLGTNFGLAPLLGKPLAIISDARLGSTPGHVVVERLLSITGEDMLTIDRKFREPWSGKLPTRFLILSNELPRFSDSSGAIAHRLLILQMTESFLGREDRDLDAKLDAELPAILNWSLEGLDRLNRNRRFTVPAASADAAAMMMDLASPMSAFVREHCELGPGKSVERDRLYLVWKTWCEDNGHESGSKATFGRNLRSVVPKLGTVKVRVGEARIRCYTLIGLVGGPPGPVDESAGQDDFSGPGIFGDPVPPSDPVFQPDQSGPGERGPRRGEEPQVRGGGPGGPGATPFKGQPVADRTSRRREVSSGGGLRCPCGNALLAAESIERGQCERCYLTRKNAGGTP